MRIALSCFCLFLCIMLTVASSKGQDIPKGEVKEKGDTAAKLRAKAAQEEASDGLVGLKIFVPKDTKVEIDGKAIPYDKFATVIEFTGQALEVEEIQWKEGRFTVLKMKNKR